MENALQVTSLSGQHLRADTFAPQAPRFVDTSLTLANEPEGASGQSPSETTGFQKEPKALQEFLDHVVQPQAKPIQIYQSSKLFPRQVWEGTVVERHEGSFIGRVVDKTNPNNPDELVTFDFDELSLDDQQLVQPGASFYWTVGTEQSRAGQISNIERLNFRRLPNWNARAVREAETKAAEIAALLFTE